MKKLLLIPLLFILSCSPENNRLESYGIIQKIHQDMDGCFVFVSIEGIGIEPKAFWFMVDCGGSHMAGDTVNLSL